MEADQEAEIFASKQLCSLVQERNDVLERQISRASLNLASRDISELKQRRQIDIQFLSGLFATEQEGGA